MRIDWYGQSAFRLVADKTLFIDPWGDMSAAAAHGITWEYPAIEDVSADLLLIKIGATSPYPSGLGCSGENRGHDLSDAGRGEVREAKKGRGMHTVP